MNNIVTSEGVSLFSKLPFNIISLIQFLGGGAAGALLTLAYNAYRNRIQYLTAKILVDQYVSLSSADATVRGRACSSLKTMHFEVKNSTNKDIAQFEIIFSYPEGAEIINRWDRSKAGDNRLATNILLANQISYIINTFNRKNKVEFQFTIANTPTKQLSVEVTGVLGVEIRTVRAKVLQQSINPPVLGVIR